MKVKPFRGIRPPQALAKQVSSRPYDVLNSAEARVEAAGNPMSLYHIIKPEINFEENVDEHDSTFSVKKVGWYKIQKIATMFMRKQWMAVHNMVWYLQHGLRTIWKVAS